MDQNYDTAIFQDLGSQPATMEAPKAADCFGCAPGHAIQVADVEQAYVQAPNERGSHMGSFAPGGLSGQVQDTV